MDLTGLEREDLIEIIGNQADYIKRLEAQLNTAEKAQPVQKKQETKPTIPQPVEVLGSLRLFRFPTFRYNGKVHRSDEVVLDKSLLEEIAKQTGDQILRKV